MSVIMDDSTIELLDSENVWVAVKILFLFVIDPEIPWGHFGHPITT